MADRRRYEFAGPLSKSPLNTPRPNRGTSPDILIGGHDILAELEPHDRAHVRATLNGNHLSTGKLTALPGIPNGPHDDITIGNSNVISVLRRFDHDATVTLVIELLSD